jgi:hypothetical protein
VPKHAALEETDLRDKLVYHGGELKTLLDTVRIACAESILFLVENSDALLVGITLPLPST